MAALAAGPRLYCPRDCLGLPVLSVTAQLWTFRLPRGPASWMESDAQPVFAHAGVVLALSRRKGEGSRWGQLPRILSAARSGPSTHICLLSQSDLFILALMLSVLQLCFQHITLLHVLCLSFSRMGAVSPSLPL